MNDLSATLPPTMPPLKLKPQDRPRNRGRNALFSIGLSIAVIGAVTIQLRGFDINAILGMVPRSPLFWVVFAIYYFATPAIEWMIFNKLWNIPLTGFFALLRKMVYNDLLLGYLGEAYFYSWSRRRVSLDATPFGAVKDVAILSAITANAVTLALMAMLLPFVGSSALSTMGIETKPLAISLGVIVAISVAVMFWRKRVFTLPKSQLFMIARMHLLRIITATVLMAVLWHLALPEVALTWWLALATLRMLVSRLPLVPNKDLLFAGIAVLVLGQEREIGALIALMAALYLAAHLIAGSVLAIKDLIQPETN